MTGMRPALVVLAAFLVTTGVALGASPVRGTLTTSTSTPVVDAPWRYTIVVKSVAGKPVPAKTRLQILLGTLVVGCWKGNAMTMCSNPSEGTWIPFKGKLSRTLTWPAQAEKVKLTFQAVVVAGGRTLRLRAPVLVHSA